MSAQFHTIDRLTFDFTITENALDLFKVNMYNEVSAFLLPVIEEVFESSFFSDYDIQIDTLNIDLGCILIESESIKSCADRLKCMLEDELKKQIQNNTGNNCTILPRKKNDERILLYYLNSGVVVKRYSGTPDALLEEMLKNDCSLLVQFLIDNKNSDCIIRRFVWQFRIELIEQIIVIVNKSDHEFIRAFVDTLRVQQKVQKESAEKRIIIHDTTRYHRHILEFTLKYCLSEKQVQFNRVDFVHRILIEISNHYNIGLLTFIQTIYETLQNTAFDSSYRNELLYLLGAIRQKTVTIDRPLFEDNLFRLTNDTMHDSGNRIVSDKKGRFLSYATTFISYIDSGTLNKECREFWDLMINESQQDSVEFIYKHFNNRRIIKNFVRLMDKERITECIQLFAHNNLEYIVKVVTTCGTFVNSTTAKKQQVVMDANAHRHYVYEFILEYCIRQRNGVFSELTFTHAILAGIANHHYIDYVSLLVTVLEFLITEVKCEENSEYSKLLNCMQQLYNQHCRNKKSALLSINRKVSREIGIVTRYDNLVRCIINDEIDVCGMEKNGRNSFTEELKIMYDSRPDLIYSLFEKIKNRPDCISKICNNNNLNFCNALMTLFVQTIVDRYNQIQWNRSRSETVTLFRQVLERTVLTKYRYDDLMTVLLTLDYSAIISEETLHSTIIAKLHDMTGRKNENYLKNNNSVECKQTESSNLELFSTETIIDYLYYFIEHPGNTERQGITREQLLDYCIKKHRNTLINECITILLRKPDLKYVVSQSDFLFDLRLRNCLQQSPKFAIIAKAYTRKKTGKDTPVNFDNVNCELLNYMCGEFHSENIFSDILENDHIETTIKTLFSFLHSGSVLNGEDISNYSRIIGLMLKKYPNRLKWWIKDSSSNNSAIDNLLTICTESQFIQLLLLFGTHSAMVMHSYFITVKKLMCTQLPGGNLTKRDVLLKKVIFSNILKYGSEYHDDHELVEKIGEDIENSISDQQEKKILKNIIEQSNKEWNVNDDKVVGILNKNPITTTSINNKKMENEIAPLKNELLNILMNDDNIEKEEILVTNAGIVLGAAYFERLFDMVHLTKNKEFIDDHAIQKSLKILHYFATGNCNFPEYEMTLNKIICGVALNFQIDPEIDISIEDKETADSLVDAIIKNWPVMKNTQRDSFREAFLTRRGYISKCEDSWVLNVEKRAFDMLIDTVPWGFSMIKFPWMKMMVQTKWNEK